MTSRRITREQFSDSLAIDSSRIQKAMDDIEGYTNAVPLKALKNKFSMNHIVLTCQGAETPDNLQAIGAQAGRMLPCPYFPATQGSAERIKGTARLSTDATATTAAPLTTALAWTTSTIFPRPVVLDTISLFIEGVKLSAAQTAGLGLAFSLFGIASDESYHRVRLIVDTDNMTAAEDRRLNSKEFVIKEFDEVEFSDAVQVPGSGVVDMKPSDIMAPGSRGVTRLYLEKSNINLPIHQFARVRFRVVLHGPGLGSSVATVNAEVRPVQTTLCIAYKEMLRG